MDFFYRNRIGFLLAIIKFCLPFFLQHSMYEMHRDEFLYLEQGNTTTPMAREKGVKIILFKNGNDKVNNMITEGIRQKKSEYQR